MELLVQETPTLQRGARIRYPLRDANGTLLLAAGAEVTDRLCRLLQQRGIRIGIQACLRVIQGDNPGLEVPVRKREFLIGRRPDCDLQFDSSVVSGHHCRLYKRDLVLYLHDLGSRNHTFLNGIAIEGEVAVNDRDQLRVGHAEFAIQIFAALEADSEEGTKALNAWKVAESLGRRCSSPYSPTMADLDLDAV